MDVRLVFKTKDHYIELMKDKIEVVDSICSSKLNSEEKLRKFFESKINDEDGEFKILVDPQSIPLIEFQYHTDIIEFNQIHEIDVKYDLKSKQDIIIKLGDLMIESDKVLRHIYNRHNDCFKAQDKMMYLIGANNHNKKLQLSIIGSFVEERFKDDSSYLYLRDLYTECLDVRKKELKPKQI